MTEIKHIQPLVKLYTDNYEYDLSEFVFSVSVQKSLRQPTHTCNINFTPALSKNLTMAENSTILFLKKILKPQTIISVKIDRNSKKHTFLGLIDHISEQVSTQNESTRRSLNVNCSLLLPKLLLRDSVVNSPIMMLIDKVTNDEELKERAKFIPYLRGAIRDEKGNIVDNVFYKGDPKKAIEYILDKAPATNTIISYKGYKPKSFFKPEVRGEDGKEIINLNFRSNDRIFGMSLSIYTGNLLGWIASIIDQPFYEFYFDTVTGEDGLAYNSMIIRPKPFSLSNEKEWTAFDELETVTKNSNQRLYENIGINDYELKNFFTVTYKHNIAFNSANYLGQTGFMYPALNIESIKKYGLRELSVSSNTLSLISLFEKYNKEVDDEKQLEVESLIETMPERRDKIVEWFAFPFFASGQITFIGDEELTIGKRLRYEDYNYFDVESDQVYRGTDFYIDTVTHQFSYPSTFTSAVQVVRGAPEGLVKKWLEKNEPNMKKVDFILRDKENDYKVYTKEDAVTQLKKDLTGKE